MSKKHKKYYESNNNGQKGTIIVLVFSIVIVGGFLMFMLSGSQEAEFSGNNVVQAKIDEATGKQIIDLTARGGYKPGSIEAKAGIDSILRVATNNTYDCSLGLRIPSLGISKNLPSTGITDIPISAQKAGTVVKGTCTMGMYYFAIKFT